jgi:PPOX class probable FMN-dependent enzyme
MEAAIRKDIGHIDDLCRRLIAASPMLFAATFSPQGHADVSPRGGQPGFVTVLDEQHLAIPDATGNRRLDTLENIVSSGRVGVIFLIPGRDTTLRVNGRASVTAEPELLERLTPVGKPPKTAIVVEAEEVYTHCPKAFVRSKLWDPETWLDPATLPTSAEVTLAHQRNPELTLEQVEEREREALAKRLA